MTSNIEDVILSAAACVILCRRRVKSKRRFWVRPSLRASGTYSGTTLLKDLAMDDIHPLTGEIKCDGRTKNFLRMTSSDFEYLINQIGDRPPSVECRGYFCLLKIEAF
nr:unnamed protein product [Callosobruchus analis]